MKRKHLKIASLGLMLLAGVASCKKDDSSSGTPNTPNNPPGIAIGTIRAKVDGKLMTADKNVKADMTSSIKAVYIAGTGGSNTNVFTFNLGIGDFNGTGTYDLGVYDSHGLGVNALYQEPALGGYACTPQYPETKGKLTVTEFTADKSIKGTFNYKAKKQGTMGSGGDYIDVTEGEFFISLP